jgi:hypothetical protein
MFDRNAPFNDLPPLPPSVELESKAILKKAITASRALAELKGMAERMPNQAMLIDSLVLQEARASSEIENILTTNDELFKAEPIPTRCEPEGGCVIPTRYEPERWFWVDHFPYGDGHGRNPSSNYFPAFGLSGRYAGGALHSS